MQALWIISLFILLLYLIRILTYRTGWYRTIQQESPEGELPGVSVVVPVRNEENSISLLLNDLIAQDYPDGKYEIIIVDDHSSDATRDVITGITDQFNNSNPGIRLIALDPGETGKKAGLKKGNSIANHPLILNTDGDCRASAGWIRGMAEGFSDPGLRMMTGAVIFESGKGLFHALQCLELFSHTAISAGSAGLQNPILCSAANLAYYKDDYLDFIREQKKESESGDDIFLMLWLKKRHPGTVRFNASMNAVIRTGTAGNPGSFFRQRIRWTSKSRYYRDFHIISTALIVFGVNVLLTVLLFGCVGFPLLTGSIPNGLLPLFAGLLTGKSLTDLILLMPVLRHYQSPDLLWYFIPLELIYFMYVSFTGLAGQILNVSWKGRKIHARPD